MKPSEAAGKKTRALVVFAWNKQVGFVSSIAAREFEE
jgi:hypothetical protein